jgi:hypothetical protein
MAYFLALRVAAAIIGAFVTAYVHEKTGRDVTMGGLIGIVVGAIGGWFFLMLLWLWLYYDRTTLPIGRMYNARRPPWYRWWD